MFLPLPTIPAYKLTRVAARIGVLIYCHKRGVSPQRGLTVLLPTAMGFAAAAMLGLSTADLPGLLRVAVKVAEDLMQMPLPVDESVLQETAEHLSNYPQAPYLLQVWRGEAELSLSAAAIRGVTDVLRFWDLEEIAAPVVETLFEEFNFSGLRAFFSSLYR